MKVRSLLRSVLLCFVLISIGYALGKETTLRRMPSAEPDDGVVVYYMYPAIRCIECNQIESVAHKVVHDEFAEALNAGRLHWKEVNISENEALAKRYNVATSVVVVVRRRDGADAGFQRLDEVWELAGKPAELAARIRSAIQAALAEGDAK